MSTTIRWIELQLLEGRMKIFLQSLNYELWNKVEAPYIKLTTNYTAWSDDQKKNANLDAKAMNALFCALTKEEFNRVSTATSANQIWHILQVTHEGTNKVKAVSYTHLTLPTIYSV